MPPIPFAVATNAAIGFVGTPGGALSGDVGVGEAVDRNLLGGYHIGGTDTEYGCSLHCLTPNT